MKLLDNWEAVFWRAWSIRWSLAAGVFAGCEMSLPVIDQVLDIPRGLFAAASGLATFGSVVSRLIAQSTLVKPSDPKGDRDAGQ